MSEASTRLGRAGTFSLELWNALQEKYFGTVLSRKAITCGDRRLDGHFIDCRGKNLDLSIVNDCIEVASTSFDQNKIDAGDLATCFIADMKQFKAKDLIFSDDRLGRGVTVQMSESAVREVLKYHGIELKDKTSALISCPDPLLPGLACVLKDIAPSQVIATNEAYRKLAGIDERLGSITGKELLRGLEMMLIDEMGKK